MSDNEIVVSKPDYKNQVKFGWCKTGYHKLCLRTSSSHTCACECHESKNNE